jgi:hypothetical protein
VNKFTNELIEVSVQDDDDVLYEYIKDLDLNELV